MPDTAQGIAKPTILVVEDEVPLLTLLRYNLEKQGFRVDEAGDGEEALLRVAEGRPDLVLLDWMLPALSGIEVCRDIRSSHPEIHCLMLTSYADDEAMLDSVVAGAAGYVLKQIRGNELVESIRKAATASRLSTGVGSGP